MTTNALGALKEIPVTPLIFYVDEWGNEIEAPQGVQHYGFYQLGNAVLLCITNMWDGHASSDLYVLPALPVGVVIQTVAYCEDPPEEMTEEQVDLLVEEIGNGRVLYKTDEEFFDWIAPHYQALDEYFKQDFDDRVNSIFKYREEN
jgi:hypothetical protein